MNHDFLMIFFAPYPICLEARYDGWDNSFNRDVGCCELRFQFLFSFDTNHCNCSKMMSYQNWLRPSMSSAFWELIYQVFAFLSVIFLPFDFAFHLNSMDNSWIICDFRSYFYFSIKCRRKCKNTNQSTKIYHYYWRCPWRQQKTRWNRCYFNDFNPKGRSWPWNICLKKKCFSSQV